MSTPSTSTTKNSTPAPEPASVTGVQLMQGIGVRPAVGFWQDAWGSVLKRPSSVLAVAWLGLIAFMAVFAGVLASGHPIWIVTKTATGELEGSSPLWANLTSLDLVLILGTLAGAAWTFFGPGTSRGKRAAGAIGGLILAVAIVAIAQLVQNYLTDVASEAIARARTVAQRTGVAPDFQPPFIQSEFAGLTVAAVIAGLGLAVGLLLPYGKLPTRIAIVTFACLLAGWAVQARFVKPMERFDYERRIEAGTITSATWTIVPWSPLQRDSGVQRKPPGTRYGEETNRPDTAALANFHFRLGTDAFGQDVLSQLMHASRLAISIGLVSTSIALLIGVTLGALMGYFGGWVDTLGMRIVEIFMAVPVLFLLIVMAGVLPEELRTAYVLMAIIGCFTWTGMARFTRAEFMKLRNQDFVQAAQATGLPLHSILFKHMLPNGVAPVLVDTSFAIAAAIGVEATLSYLNLGPTESASWGKLLQSAVSSEGEFKWWLAVFPGGAIFLTVLAYNLLGEALRDAIDPKLKKARV